MVIVSVVDYIASTIDNEAKMIIQYSVSLHSS